MADFLKSISNRVNIFGGEYSTKWGQSFGSPYTMVLGTTKWGEGSYTVVIDVEKLIENSLSQTMDLSMDVEKIIINTFSVILVEDMSSEKLSQGIWDYVFSPNTNEAEDRVTPTWSEQTNQVASWTCLAAATTVWS